MIMVISPARLLMKQPTILYTLLRLLATTRTIGECGRGMLWAIGVAGAKLDHL